MPFLGVDGRKIAATVILTLIVTGIPAFVIGTWNGSATYANQVNRLKAAEDTATAAKNHADAIEPRVYAVERDQAILNTRIGALNESLHRIETISDQILQKITTTQPPK